MDHLVIGEGQLALGRVVGLMQSSNSYAVLLENWRSFSYCLNIHEAKIEDLDFRLRLGTFKIGEIPRELLKTWRADQGSSATLGKLCDALVSCGVREISESLQKTCIPPEAEILQQQPGTSRSEPGSKFGDCSNQSINQQQSARGAEAEEKSVSWWNYYVARDLSRTYIGSTFNAYFGRNTTHIKNESETDIVAVISSYTGSVSKISVANDGSVTVTPKVQKEGTTSSVLIPPGVTTPFERKNRVDYLTIGYKNDNGSVTISATDVQILANISYRVYPRGVLKCRLYDY